jgi:small conductance mechanosensitive channel
MLWQWFIDNGIYVIIAISIGIILMFYATRLSVFIANKLFPDQKRKELQNLRKISASVLTIILWIIIIFPVISFSVSRFGVDVAPAFEPVTEWLALHGILIVVIIIGAFLVNKVITLLLPVFLQRLIKMRGKSKRAQQEAKTRSDTLSGFLNQTISIIVVFLALFMILSEIGVDIGPLLVGAGFVGIAVGFGAQKLISDILNGLFIVIEDYYNVGDVVSIAGLIGTVEEVNVRRTVLRDLDGIVHIVPNSLVDKASNYTKNWARVNLNVPVAYGENIDRVINVLNTIGNELKDDEYFGQLLISAPQVLRVDKFGDSAIEIKVVGDTYPMKQWEVTGELRKRIKQTFDQKEIEIPWPITKVYFGNAPMQKEEAGKAVRKTKKKTAVNAPEVARCIAT